MHMHDGRSYVYGTIFESRGILTARNTNTLSLFTYGGLKTITCWMTRYAQHTVLAY